jgi:hypothetical protein
MNEESMRHSNTARTDIQTYVSLWFEYNVNRTHCSLPLSKGPYPEPDKSSQYHLTLQDSSQYYPPTYVFVFLVLSFLLAF